MAANDQELQRTAVICYKIMHMVKFAKDIDTIYQ